MRAQANGYFHRELQAASRFLRCIKSARSSSLRSSKFCGGSSTSYPATYRVYPRFRLIAGGLSPLGFEIDTLLLSKNATKANIEHKLTALFESLTNNDRFL